MEGVTTFTSLLLAGLSMVFLFYNLLYLMLFEIYACFQNNSTFSSNTGENLRVI